MCAVWMCVYASKCECKSVLLQAVSLVISITSHHHWHILLGSVFIPMPEEDAAVIKINGKMK